MIAQKRVRKIHMYHFYYAFKSKNKTNIILKKDNRLEAEEKVEFKNNMYLNVKNTISSIPTELYSIRTLCNECYI